MANLDLITIAIPIFNETNGTVNLIEEALSLPIKKEIIIIDDGSTNLETRQIMSDLAKKYAEILIISNAKNIGKSASIQFAIKKAKGNIFVILDGDNELNPKDIIPLYTALVNENASLANGARVIKKTKPHSFSQVITRLARITFGSLINFFYGIRVNDVLSGYKLFYTDDFKNHSFSTKRFGLESDLLVATLNNKRKIVELDVEYTPRSYKQGKRINFFDAIEILSCIITNIPIGKKTMSTPFGLMCIGILLFLSSIYIYTLSANSSSTSDSLPNNFTTVNILYNKRLDLTNFRTYFQIRHQKSVVVENNRGELYAKTPLINGILAVPFFSLFDNLHHVSNVTADAFIKSDYETYYQSVGKYYASFLTALSVVFIFLGLRVLFSSTIFALVGVFSYAFATMAYSTASQGNWQHAPSLLLLSISFALFFPFLRSKNAYLFILVSILLSLSALIRISNLFFLVSLFSVLSFYKPYRKSLMYGLATALFVICLWQLVTIRLGVPGGYNGEIIQSFQSLNLLYTIQVIRSLLFSPNVGLLIFYPVSIFGFFGIYKVSRLLITNNQERSQPLFIFFRVLLISFLLLFLFNAIWWAWEGGYSFGPRLLIETIPAFIYLAIYFIYTQRSNIIKIFLLIIFIALSLYSTVINTIGIYANDNQWHSLYYQEGVDRMTMAWQTKPSILSYYVFKRKLYFVQQITYENGRVKLEKTYYSIDPLKRKVKKIKIDKEFL